MTRPRVSGSSKSMMIISPWAKVENRAIAVPVETRGHVFLTPGRGHSAPGVVDGL